MNPRLFEVALKRERLLERIGAQREQLAAASGGLRLLCAGADRVTDAGRKLRDNPEWVALAALVLAAIRPRRAWHLAKSAFFLWRVWLAVRRRLPKIPAR